MAILVSKQVGMIQLTEVLVMGRETMEEFLFWTLKLPMNCWWKTPFLRRMRTTW